LTEEERDIVSEFITSLMNRTRGSRNEIKDASTQLIEKLGLARKEDIKSGPIWSAIENSAKNVQKSILTKDTSIFKERIKKMKWILIINKLKFPIWTSDNPVAKYNENNSFPYGNLGLDCKGFEMHIPLSPKIVLIVCDPIEFSHEPSKKIMKSYREVARERDHQVRNSTRFVFSVDNNFRFAQMMIKNHPELRDQKQKKSNYNIN